MAITVPASDVTVGDVVRHRTMAVDTSGLWDCLPDCVVTKTWSPVNPLSQQQVRIFWALADSRSVHGMALLDPDTQVELVRRGNLPLSLFAVRSTQTARTWWPSHELADAEEMTTDGR